ncbi:MAG: hypothetical protein ABI609_01130 [Acidobacteriota bacterium]
MKLLVLLFPVVVAALFAIFFRREPRRHPKALADLLPWGALIADGVIVNKDGSFTAGWIYRGPDLDSATHEEMAVLTDHLNAALLALGDGWMLQADAIRRPSADYPPIGAFPDPVTRLIDQERREQYQVTHRNFETTYTLLLTRETPDEVRSRFASWLVQGSEDQGVDWQAVLDAFLHTLTDIEDVLRARLEIRRLSSGELLTHLHTALTGLHHPIAVPPVPCYLDAILSSQDLVAGFAPQIGKHYLQVLAITGFPFHTVPGMLDSLNRLPIEYRWSSRFHALDPETAAQHIGRYRRQWFQKRKGLGAMVRENLSKGEAQASESFDNKDAVAMAHDADAALAKANAGAVRWGYYTPTLILMHPDAATLKEITREVAKEIRNRGFAAREESVNNLEAFLGSLPACGSRNVRRPLINTLNLADLLPITALWPGLAANPSPFFPEKSPALLWAATSGSTPFRLNLHVSDVGHTLIVGPTGSGKSAFVAMLQAQWFRYPEARVFTFDKGYSSRTLVEAAGGTHYDIAADQADDIAFHPLALVDRDSERAWAAEWLEGLLLLNGFKVLPPHRQAIDRALKVLAVQPQQQRTLTTLQATVQDNSIRQALAPYVLGSSHGRLLDADTDAMRDGHFQVFEMDALMKMGEKTVVPVLLYLFHQIERRLTGQPTLIVIEEAWTFLLQETFAERIQSWLKELRKKNALVVFVTQSLGDIQNSPMRHVLYESCPTKIFLANPEAGNEQGSSFYRSIGLNDRQIEIVARALPKRDYYYASPNGRRLIDLTLGPVALAFVGAGSAENLRAVRELRSRVGEQWPVAWLRARGLATWAERLEALYLERSAECAS